MTPGAYRFPNTVYSRDQSSSTDIKIQPGLLPTLFFFLIILKIMNIDKAYHHHHSPTMCDDSDCRPVGSQESRKDSIEATGVGRW